MNPESAAAIKNTSNSARVSSVVNPAITKSYTRPIQFSTSSRDAKRITKSKTQRIRAETGPSRKQTNVVSPIVYVPMQKLEFQIKRTFVEARRAQLRWRLIIQKAILFLRSKKAIAIMGNSLQDTSFYFDEQFNVRIALTKIAHVEENVVAPQAYWPTKEELQQQQVEVQKVLKLKPLPALREAKLAYIEKMKAEEKKARQDAKSSEAKERDRQRAMMAKKQAQMKQEVGKHEVEEELKKQEERESKIERIKEKSRQRALLAAQQDLEKLQEYELQIEEERKKQAEKNEMREKRLAVHEMNMRDLTIRHAEVLSKQARSKEAENAQREQGLQRLVKLAEQWQKEYPDILKNKRDSKPPKGCAWEGTRRGYRFHDELQPVRTLPPRLAEHEEHEEGDPGLLGLRSGSKHTKRKEDSTWEEKDRMYCFRDVLHPIRILPPFPDHHVAAPASPRPTPVQLPQLFPQRKLVSKITKELPVAVLEAPVSVIVKKKHNPCMVEDCGCRTVRPRPNTIQCECGHGLMYHVISDQASGSTP